ncbi:MAG: UPF0149 family protein [Povalibacter sp.]
MLQVTFPEIVEVMRSAGSTVPASEGHGCLCGALCVSADYRLERWLEELVELDETAPIPPDLMQSMHTLYQDTVAALRGDQMDFEPFLPDDSVTLEQRATAISQWCQGFLYGFGTTRAIQAGQMPKSVDEILIDFTNIGRAEAQSGEDSEEDEEAYTQVVEYIRAAVQLIHDELEDLRNGDDSNVALDDQDSDELDPDDPDYDAIH